MFQSLRGFGVGWSAPIKAEYTTSTEFQSLRGFGVGWSKVAAAYWAIAEHVSIPERVWGGLERLRLCD